MKIDWKSVGARCRLVARRVARLLFTEDAATFLAFLLLASLFWVMYNVGARRSTTVEIPLQYVGIPGNALLERELPNTLSVTVRDEGQVLINYRLKADVDTLVIDLSDAFAEGNTLSVDYRSQMAAVRHRLPETSQIVAIKPEAVAVSYARLEQKNLPVRLTQQIPLAVPYVLLDSVRFVPASVEVFAPHDVLDTLQSVDVVLSSPIELLTKSATFQCALKPVRAAKFDVETVEVSVPIEMSTEKTLELNIAARNFPDDVQLRTFPPTVKVVCSIGVSRFEALSPADFSAYVDYDDIQKNGSYKAQVRVVTDNSHVRSLHFSPAEVEFLLEK